MLSDGTIRRECQGGSDSTSSAPLQGVSDSEKRRRFPSSHLQFVAPRSLLPLENAQLPSKKLNPY